MQMLSDAIKGRIWRPGSEANTGLMSLAHNALGFPSVNKVLGHVESRLCYTATGFICHFRSSTCMFHLPVDQYETQYKLVHTPAEVDYFYCYLYLLR